jgi:hypothetical protein
MSDETLEISREKLFELLSKSFSDITHESVELMKTNNMDRFVKRIETIIDELNHDILNKCKREKPIIMKDDSRIEVDWS